MTEHSLDRKKQRPEGEAIARPVRRRTAQQESLYRQIANSLAAAMQSGTLLPGDRLPSVRSFHRQQAVSITTVLAAYRLLEAQGWIEACPKSGYFVSASLRNCPEPERISKGALPRLVGITEQVFKILEAANQAHIVQLGAACPDPSHFPATALRRELHRQLCRHPELIGSYSHNASGNLYLRRQVARRLLRQGCQVSADEIVITSGCTEAINLALRAVTQPGDTVAVESPTYYGLLQILESLGLKAAEMPTHPRTGIVIESLELATRQSGAIKACVLVPNHSNPLGSVMPEECKAQIASLLGDRGIPLIEDDVYGELAFSDERPPVIKAWDRQGMVLQCSSFSKTLAPGLRIGWIAPGRCFHDVKMLKFQTTVSTPDLLQQALAAFVDTGGYDGHLRKLRRGFQHQMAQTSAAVAKHFPEGTRISRPAGGFLLWIELPGRLDAGKLAELALRDGISIAPGAMFSSQPQFRSCIRLNCGHAWSSRIEGAIRRLGELAIGMSSTTS